MKSFKHLMTAFIIALSLCFGTGAAFADDIIPAENTAAEETVSGSEEGSEGQEPEEPGEGKVPEDPGEGVDSEDPGEDEDPDEPEEPAYEKKNGLVQDADGVWCYYADDEIQEDFTGIVQNGDEWWYVENGKANFDATGVFQNENGWWRVEGGKVNFNATGIYQNKNGWWYVKDGKADFGATGVYQNENGWWRVEGGKVNFNATGVYQNENGWWRVENGKVNFNATGIFQNQNGWWYVKNGKVDFGATGIFQNELGWWRVEGGRVNFSANGVYPNDRGWWKVTAGRVDFGFTGLADNENGKWKIVNGRVDFNANTIEKSGSVWYKVQNGKDTVLDLDSLSMVNFVKARAKMIASEITNDSMTDAEKIRACFDYTQKNFASTDNPRIPHYTGEDWIYIYANDMFSSRAGGNCMSFAAAFSFLCRAAGIEESYAINSGGHAWSEINGLVYDPEQYHDTNRKIYAYSYSNPEIGSYQYAIFRYTKIPSCDEFDW